MNFILNLTAASVLLLISSISFAKDVRMNYNFGSVQVGTTKSLQWGLRAKEQGLRFKEISMLGEAFHHRTNCPTELAPLERCVVEVLFKPATHGLHSGLLFINMEAEKFIIDIVGEGL
ncbi:hypothetical protein D3C87_1449730 [compost metagenome]